jgi:hypothetical protein
MAAVTILILMTEIQTVPHTCMVTAVVLCSNKELTSLTECYRNYKLLAALMHCVI